jgi:hypothetical protein
MSRRASWWRAGARLAFGCVAAATLGVCLPRAAAQVTPPGAAGTPVAGATAARGASPAPGSERAPGLELLPPGAARSPTPSDEIFPPQSLPLRFDHKKHVQGLRVRCTSCHAAAITSDAASDRLLPAGTTCDGCHGSDHGAREGARGTGSLGRCDLCHAGAAGAGIARVVVPPPNLRFSHRLHAARNIGCGQCHGRVGEVGLATRDALPRMAGCVRCHDTIGPGQGAAKAECPTCHLTRADGRLVQAFATGPLVPPRWLRGAEHGADWIERHRAAAAEDSGFCASCHTARECADCHDGRVRPRSVHPNDYLSMHGIAARQDSPRCVSCHQEATFCADCHRRAGVARDAASGSRATGRRFHAPPGEWTAAPRGPGHHAWEAMRNLGACVSCHTERDCATCHATKGVPGGQGVNPHPPGFASACAGPLRRNPRPCLVCHASGDRHLGACR